MDWRAAFGRSWSGRVVAASLLLCVIVGGLGLGVLLSKTYGAAQVASNAYALHGTNATLGASGITRAAVAQAVFFSFDEVSNGEALRQAVDEARTNLMALGDVVASADETLDDTTGDLARAFIAAGREVLEAIEAEGGSRAEQARMTALEPAYEALHASLSDRQSELASLVAESDQAAGRISRITFVAISFLIPAVTMLVFWVLLRRRIRAREAEMQVRIEAEKKLNASKDQFIAGLSHELRTPLTTIVGFSELLIANSDIDADGREQLELIHGSSADLTRMVEDLLTAARLDAGALSTRPEPFDITDAIENATSSYLLSGRELEIRTTPIDVYADPLHVRQIIHNLLSNAFRHGGANVAITATRDGSNAVVVVADDGPGVPGDLEDRLFRRFLHEGKQALVAGSVGLGLAISQELARRMGGTLRYSRGDGVTSFSLILPIVPAKQWQPNGDVETVVRA